MILVVSRTHFGETIVTMSEADEQHDVSPPIPNFEADDFSTVGNHEWRSVRLTFLGELATRRLFPALDPISPLPRGSLEGVEF